MTRTPHLSLALLLGLGACSSGTAGSDDVVGDDDPVPPDASIGECEAASAGSFAFEKIAAWRDDAKGAYSFIHDDMCDPTVHGIQELAVPAMAEAGISSGIAAIANECEGAQMWALLAEIESKGHEIVNHSFSHPEITPANMVEQITQAKAMFDAHLEHPVTFFVFPYDYFTDATIATMASSGHLGGRAGNRDDNDGFEMPPLNPADPTSDLRVEFDVWPRNYSKYALFFPEEILTVHAYNAIEKGGWAMREFHSVIADGADPIGQGFGPIKLGEYQRHLQFLVDARKKGLLWTAPPSTVLRYRHARTACTASVAGDKITFNTSNPDCTKYATPISVIVTTTEDLPRIDAIQAGVTVSTKKLAARRFSVTADPTLGEVALSGCSNPGYEIDPDLALTPKPTPAASVCQIESVVGAGGAGKMDDLERPTDQFQVLPNPAQADGRTGSWSWYPQPAQVGMQAGALRFAGTGLAAWSGATLAFLGGNGAGACYDGTAYQGIRFKVKGSVTGGDLAGKAIVSIVTAETQSRLYGGDLVGEGGHFNKVIPVTATWQTISIPWADLTRPTWGATATLTAVAKAKLQAIDWGVSNTATSFEIFIDDVEMF